MRRSSAVGFWWLRRSHCGLTDSAAQETGTPMFKAPYRAFTTHEFGAAFSDPGEGCELRDGRVLSTGRGPRISIRGRWSSCPTRPSVGSPKVGGSTRILLGGDFRTRMLTYSESFPLDGALTVGAGINVGDGDDLIYLPVGISLGRRFELEGFQDDLYSLRPSGHRIPLFGGAEGAMWISRWVLAWTCGSAQNWRCG